MQIPRAVIDEVIGIADDHDVDLVVHSGDLFDRSTPPVEALRVAATSAVPGRMNSFRRPSRPKSQS